MANKAYAAEVDANGIVVNVIAILDPLPEGVSFDEFCALHGARGSTWRRTYKDRSRRKNYAGKGYTFDANMDAFVPPRPRDHEDLRMESWRVDPETARWIPPEGKEYPSDGATRDNPDGKRYEWSERQQEWVERAREILAPR